MESAKKSLLNGVIHICVISVGMWNYANIKPCYVNTI